MQYDVRDQPHAFVCAAVWTANIEMGSASLAETVEMEVCICVIRVAADFGVRNVWAPVAIGPAHGLVSGCAGRPVLVGELSFT